MEATQVCYDIHWLKRLLKAIFVFSYLLILYYQLVGHTIWVVELMALSFFGLLLGTMWVVRYGEKGAQTRFENGTGIILGSGFHFQWNLFPPFRDIGVTLGLGIEIIEDRYLQARSRDDRHLHQDTRDARINTKNLSLLGLAVYQIVRGISTFLFNFKDEGGRFMYYKIGRLVSIVALILGVIANIFSPNASSSQKKNFFSLTSKKQDANSREPREGMTLVYTSLREGMAPKMPLSEKFIPKPSGNTQEHFIVDGDVDKRKYLYFHEPVLGKIRTVYVHESLCAVIPAGRETFFVTKFPPMFEGNMELSVRYNLKKEYRNILYELYRAASGKSSEPYTTSWIDIHNNWNKVDLEAENSGIRVRAIPEDSLPEHGKEFGGIVCF